MQKRTQEILKHVDALHGELRSADTKMDETHGALHLPCRAAAAGRREGHLAKNGHWRLAAEPILISHYAGQMDMRRATTVQLLTADCWRAGDRVHAVAGGPVPAFSWIWLAAAVCLRVERISVQFIFTCIDRVEPDRAAPAVELHESV